MLSPETGPRLSSTAALIALALVYSAPAPAMAMFGDTDDVFGLDGSLRMVGAATARPNFPEKAKSDGQAQILLRLVTAGYPTEWLHYEAHILQMVSIRTANASLGNLGGAGAEGPGAALRYRLMDDRWRWYDGYHVAAQATFDRLNVKFMLPFADVTVGRQAITFGKAYFWNPLDVFAPFDATAFDRDYKFGVDAIHVAIPIGDFSGVTVVSALGRPDGGHFFYRSAFLARAFTNVFDWDFSVQAGKVFGGVHAGIGAAGELGPVELRAEGAFFWPLEDLAPENASLPPDGITAVLGVGYSFTLLERLLMLQAEYLYNGPASQPLLAERFVLAAKGLMQQVTEHALGTLVSYQVLPLLSASFATLFAMSDHPSVLLQPGISFSAADEVELVAGAMVVFGEPPQHDAQGSYELKSEFGTYPHVFYLETKIYF